MNKARMTWLVEDYEDRIEVNSVPDDAAHRLQREGYADDDPHQGTYIFRWGPELHIR